MTKADTKNKISLVPGDQIHFLRSGFSFGTKLEDPTGVFVHTSTRGETITITQGIIECSKDRNGDSWLELVDDLDAQARRWSHGPYFAAGPAPEDMTAWEPFTIEATLEFEARRQVIYDTEKDPDQLAIRLRELQRSPLGRSLYTGKNTTVYDAEAPKNANAQDWGY